MCSQRPSAERRHGQAGFTLIELMIGVVIGLLASLAVTHVLVSSEGQKRTTTSASDAQLNGALALSTLHRTVQQAGYGFGATPSVIGCPLTATHSGAVVGMPDNLVPVIITDGVAGAPDTVRVFASGKKTFSVPLRIVVPGYAAGNKTLPVSTIRSIENGDIIVAAQRDGTKCETFQVSSDPAAANEVPRGDNEWNTAGSPAGPYPDGSFAINMGAPSDITYSIVSDSLRARSLTIASDGTPSYDAAPVELFPNIVNLQALYGKDSDADGTVDQWDNVTPADNASWLKVVAVRLVLVSRSAHYEKEEVTFANPQWDVGKHGTVAGSAACDDSLCIELKVDGPADWKHYRYRLFDTVIPLRNMLWNS